MAGESTNKNFRVRSQKPQIIPKTENKTDTFQGKVLPSFTERNSTPWSNQQEAGIYERPYFKRSVTLMIRNLSLSLSLWLYRPLDLSRFFSFLIYTQPTGLLRKGISPSQGRLLDTEQQKHRINAHRHPCLEWDSNPRYQLSSKRRQFMP
jgi:hypothetical protein